MARKLSATMSRGLARLKNMGHTGAGGIMPATLEALAARGMIEYHGDTGSPSPMRGWFLTKTGEHCIALQEWQASPPPPPRPRCGIYLVERDADVVDYDETRGYVCYASSADEAIALGAELSGFQDPGPLMVDKLGESSAPQNPEILLTDFKAG